MLRMANTNTESNMTETSSRTRVWDVCEWCESVTRSVLRELPMSLVTSLISVPPGLVEKLKMANIKKRWMHEIKTTGMRMAPMAGARERKHQW